ncbi:hypothetical protein [Chitinophaga sp.]|uniref:hypothetical protein n=1 Tax=Chitinophaga sp. TaxID=1869181 RepID=UPI0031DFE083
MRNVYPVILLLTLFLFTSCSKIEHGDEFTRSKDVYVAFKASSKNNYEYVVITSSWVGSSTATTMTIQNGKVVGRSYVAKQIITSGGSPVVVREWTEGADSLGTHVDGATMLTLDDVYERAQKEWLKKREDADVYFEAKNSGMISNAGYVERKCADDCFRGISISSIKKL